MTNTIINQQEAITLLKRGQDLSVYSLEWNEMKIEALDGILLGRNGIQVPEDLIFYDDETIDYSDDEGLTDNDLNTGAIRWLSADEATEVFEGAKAEDQPKSTSLIVELKLSDEMNEWIENEKIATVALVNKLLCDFYDTLKMIRK